MTFEFKPDPKPAPKKKKEANPKLSKEEGWSISRLSK
jgi:hypothetical protein